MALEPDRHREIIPTSYFATRMEEMEEMKEEMEEMEEMRKWKK